MPPRLGSFPVLISALLLLAAPLTTPMAQQPSEAQATAAPGASIMGTIVGSDKKPLDAAEVLLDRTRRATTDRRGRFAFDPVAPGTYDVLIRHLGHTPVRFRLVVAAGDVFDGTITMDRTAQSLPEVIVLDSAKSLQNHRPRWMDGFLARRRMGLGTFLDRADIENAHAPTTARLIAEKAKIMLREGFGYVELRGGRCASGVGGFSKGVVWLDGIKTEETMTGRFESLVDVPPENLWAAEVYAGRGTIPPQYDDPLACLVVLLWTNRR